jgi:hypothetical protein
MSFKTLLAFAVLLGAAAVPATAAADHVSCRVGYYSPGADTATPTVTNLAGAGAARIPRPVACAGGSASRGAGSRWTWRRQARL